MKEIFNTYIMFTDSLLTAGGSSEVYDVLARGEKALIGAEQSVQAKPISSVPPKEFFCQRISRICGDWGKYLASCFCYSKRDSNNDAEPISLYQIVQMKNEPPETTQIKHSTQSVLGSLIINKQAYPSEVPTRSHVQCGKAQREKVIDLLDESISSKQGVSQPEEQLKKDIVSTPRFKSYKLKSPEGEPVELIGSDNAIDTMKAFCGDAFDDIVAIANQKMGSYGQNAIEGAFKFAEIPNKSSYAFPSETGTTLTAEISIEKKGDPPHFIISFSNEDKGQTVYQKKTNQNGKSPIYDVQLGHEDLDEKDAVEKAKTADSEMIAKTSVVIEVAKDLETNSYKKSCLELSNSYRITTPDTFKSLLDRVAT